jgi:hypothetical protein
MNIYRSFEQWKNGGFLEHGAPRTEEYTAEELHLVEMGWNYGYDAGRAVEQALDKMAENARELGLSYDDNFCDKNCVWTDHHPDCKAVQEPVEVDQATMELAESVGLIGPASRTHDLHCAIQRFHDLICMNATIKAAQMAADAIRESAPPTAPAVWKWHQAPVKTSWGHDMVVADLAIDKDNTVSVYCERDQTAKVEAMFNPPAAQPAPVQEPWKPSDTANRIGGLPQDFIEHKVENEGDWSEWVNPDSEQYFMKCCDCGLVHEMQFKVVKYSEGDECEFIDDADLQAVFRARRATPPATQKPWVGLTDEERDAITVMRTAKWRNRFRNHAKAVEQLLKEKNHG